MKNTVDDFVAGLQEQIFEETRKTYGEEVFSRWQNPKFMGKMTNASSVGRVTGRCGDSMEIYLRIRNDHIEEVNFFTDGCGASVACGSMAAELASGKGLDEAAEIGGDTIFEALGGLPEEEAHCAYLAAETLQVAFMSGCPKAPRQKKNDFAGLMVDPFLSDFRDFYFTTGK